MKKPLVIVGMMLAAAMTTALAGTKAPPNPLPKESEAVEKDGLSLAVRLARTEWKADEHLEFTVVLKNVSDKAVALWNADSPSSYHVVVNICSDDRGAGWTPEWQPPGKTTAAADQKSQTLEPGQSLEAPVSLKGLRWQYAARTKAPVKPRDRFEPGLWTLQVTRDFQASPTAKASGPARYWEGRIASAELLFRVVPGPDGARPSSSREPAATQAAVTPSVIAEAKDEATGTTVAIVRQGAAEASRNGKRLWTVNLPEEANKVAIVGGEARFPPWDRTFDLETGKLLNIGTQPGRIISVQPPATGSAVTSSGRAATPAEPVLEIRFQADDPKLNLRGQSGILALQKDRRVDYSVAGKTLVQFWLDEKQVTDFQSVLKAAGLPAQGKMTLEPLDDRMPAFQKIVGMWVLCAAPDRGRDIEAGEKQRLAAEWARFEREKQLVQARAMPTNAIPVSEVMNWPEYAAAPVVDPYAGKPRFTVEQKDALRERLKTALVPYIGEGGAVGEPQSVPPEARAWPAWTPLAAFSFRGPAGTADVWSAVSGQFGAQLRISGKTPGEREALIGWVRGLMKAVWGGELEPQPPQMNSQRYTDKRDTGPVEVSRWWFYWYANPTLGVNDRENLITVVVCQETALPQTSLQEDTWVDQSAIRKAEEEKLAASRSAHGAALPMTSGRVIFTTLTIACGTGPEQFARAWAKRPAALNERQAVARLACEIRSAAAGADLAEVAGKEGARVRKARGGANWNLTVTIPFAMSPGERKREPWQIHEGVDVRYYTVDAFSGATAQTGRHKTTEELFRKSQSPDLNVPLADVLAWPEYATAQRDAEEAIRKLRQESEAKAAKIKAAYDKWWPEAKAKAAKALTAVRPDQAALAEKFYMYLGSFYKPATNGGSYFPLRADDPALAETMRKATWIADPGKQGISVAWGFRNNNPEGCIGLVHGEDGLRLSGVRMTVPRAANDPDGKDRLAWQKFALDGFRKLWGREPLGELQPDPSERKGLYDSEAAEKRAVDRRTRNPEWHRFVWTPVWKGMPLPEGFASVFDVHPFEGGISIDWRMADESGIRKTLADLDAYPLTHSEREGIAALVKNTPVLVTDAALDKAWVLPVAWSVANLRQMLDYLPYQLFTDEVAVRAILPKEGAGPVSCLTPARLVTVDLGGKEQYPRTIVGLVDPATGRILQVNQHRQGPRPSEKID